jgi:hypothetical protein
LLKPPVPKASGAKPRGPLSGLFGLLDEIPNTAAERGVEAVGFGQLHGFPLKIVDFGRALHPKELDEAMTLTAMADVNALPKDLVFAA